MCVCRGATARDPVVQACYALIKITADNRPGVQTTEKPFWSIKRKYNERRG